MTIQILLADQDNLSRRKFYHELNTQPDIQVLAETGSGYHVMVLLEILEPDIILLDLNLMGISGIEVVRSLCDKRFEHSGQQKHAPHVIVITDYQDRQYILSFLSAGVKGYLLKSEPVEAILAGIRQVAVGHVALSQSVQSEMVYLIPEITRTLTKKESELITLLAHGLSDDDIAQQLQISVSAVRSHLQNIYRKIPWIRNRSEIVAWAWINRLVTEVQ